MIPHIKDKADLDSKIAEAGGKLVVLDFNAVWCGPCKMIGPKLEELALENTDVVILKADLDSKLAEAGDKLVLVDFHATWCGPCKMIGPKLEELANEMTDIVILKVDVDECEEIAMEYNISSMPTFVFIKNKEVITTFSGANYEKVKQTIDANK